MVNIWQVISKSKVSCFFDLLGIYYASAPTGWRH